MIKDIYKSVYTCLGYNSYMRTVIKQEAYDLFSRPRLESDLDQNLGTRRLLIQRVVSVVLTVPPTFSQWDNDGERLDYSLPFTDILNPGEPT